MNRLVRTTVTTVKSNIELKFENSEAKRHSEMNYLFLQIER